MCQKLNKSEDTKIYKDMKMAMYCFFLQNDLALHVQYYTCRMSGDETSYMYLVWARVSIV